ncbi:CHAD domain-containing protein [Mesorhizobium albiziae]|uniref:CHAD domain-containing protein n=1 Tax=Neomesorhizobium albiziae TaxID=335020 RepID=A0A1I3WI71_9HYPH|nr:CHAD domain-containing protein [Mesorhizobium albiziae]GLS31662.1 CHAD domain-containing protein [Mesorhizobium albiziae]SFK07394.1 CHAD domain-containing protein [Mesorhizobium albiziae]
MTYRIDPKLSLTGEIRRIAGVRIGKAVESLEASRTEPEKGLHNARKRFKELRALFALIRSGDRGFCRKENRRYRDIARTIAGPREATALIETLDRLAKEFPESCAGGELDNVRDALVARRERIAHDRADLGPVIDAAIASCGEGRMALHGVVLPDDPQLAADVLAEGSGRTLRHAARSLAAAAKRGKPEDFHNLRKAVKAHRMHLSLLRGVWPRPQKSRRKAVEALGDQLGDLNDIFVMRWLIDAEGRELGARKQLALLRRLLKRSEKRLRKTCLKDARRLFGEKRKPTLRKIADRYQSSAGNAPPQADTADVPA